MAQTIQEEIVQRRQARAKEEVETSKLEARLARYSDLRRHEGRWKKVVYCSAQVNEKADQYDLRHNCGCCEDSPLELWPYHEDADGRVYSDPPMFFIGNRRFGWAGDDPSPNWEKDLRDAKISEGIIEKMRAHFAASAEEEEDDGDGEDE